MRGISFSFSFSCLFFRERNWVIGQTDVHALVTWWRFAGGGWMVWRIALRLPADNL